MFTPKFVITHSIMHALAAIERIYGFLEAAALPLEWIDARQRQAFILEAYYTTHIERAQLTLEEAKQLLAGDLIDGINMDDANELLNYQLAYDLIIDYAARTEPLHEKLLRDLHHCLVQNVRSNSAAPGQYRKIQNYVLNAKTKQVIYTPPPAHEIKRMMEELIHWINFESIIHPVLIAGIAQFQLMHIYPFLDMNGRTARLLSLLCLYHKGYDFKKLFTLSENYDRNRTDYYQAIQSVRENNMDMTQWLEYFTNGLADQLQEVKLLMQPSVSEDLLFKQKRLTERQKLAIEYTTKNSVLSIRDFEKLYPQVTRRTLQRELRDLVDKNILRMSGATNNLVYQLVI